jgi:transposase
MLRAKERVFAPLCNLTVEDLVPADHFYRHLEAALELSFVRPWVQAMYAERGRPAIDPVVFFKLQLVMFFEGIRSERELLRVAADRLSLRWYLGYDLTEALPDHSSLTKIRQRYGLGVFRRFFEAIVEQCRGAGLVWGKELYFDATQVDATAALDSSAPRFAVEAHLEALFPGQGADGPDRADEANGPVELPAPIPEAVRAELEQVSAERHAWIARAGRPDRTIARGGYQRRTDFEASRTDPDAALMRRKRGGLHFGYHDHYAVDGGKARIILGVLVTPADVMENQPMLDLLWRARFQWWLPLRQVTGDTTYGTVENIVAIEDQGIRAYLPLPDWDGRTPYYGPSRFAYDAERDEYRCPEGHPLRRWTAKYTQDVVVYRAAPATCNACPVKAACTASSRGRTIQRQVATDYLERVRAYHQTAAYQKAMRKRSVWVEPLFGEAKAWHGLARFRLRGLWKVNVEALLIAAGQNLKRLLRKRGWGRRPFPTGAPGLAQAPDSPPRGLAPFPLLP